MFLLFLRAVGLVEWMFVTQPPSFERFVWVLAVCAVLGHGAVNLLIQRDRVARPVLTDCLFFALGMINRVNENGDPRHYPLTNLAAPPIPSIFPAKNLLFPPVGV